MKTWRTKEMVMWRLKLMIKYPHYHGVSTTDECFRRVVKSDVEELIHHYEMLEAEYNALKGKS